MRRTQLDRSGLVDPVHIAEDRSKQIEVVAREAEHFGGPHHVLGGGVELVLVDALRGPWRPPCRRRSRSRARESNPPPGIRRAVRGRGRGSPRGGASRHRACGSKTRGRLRSARRALLKASKWPNVRVDFLGLAVVGVEGEVDRIALSDDVGEFGQGRSARWHVFDLGARQELGSAGADLHDPVRFRLGESGEGTVERLAAGDVDRRVGEAAGSRRQRASPGTSRGWQLASGLQRDLIVG